MEKERLVNFVKRFSGKKIAVVGDIVLDSYLFGKVSRVNPERPGYPLLMVEKEEFRLGCAANVGMNLASLGAIVSVYGCIGDDKHGIIIKEMCEKNRIKLKQVNRETTITKQRWIESTHNDYLGRADFGEEKIEPLNESLANELLNDLIKNNFEAIILSDYNKGVFKNGFAQKIIEYANSKGIITVVDPKPANALSFKGATLIRPNLSEAQIIIGEKEQDFEVLARKLKEKVGSKEIVITCGGQGMITYDSNKGFNHIKTKARQVIDVTGAGDTVASVLTISLLAGANLVEAAHIANYAAGIVVEKMGTASTTQEELIIRILSDGEN
jgi:rfaE bifunctional protein kinase chain/domain